MHQKYEITGRLSNPITWKHLHSAIAADNRKYQPHGQCRSSLRTHKSHTTVQLAASLSRIPGRSLLERMKEVTVVSSVYKKVTKKSHHWSPSRSANMMLHFPSHVLDACDVPLWFVYSIYSIIHDQVPHYSCVILPLRCCNSLRHMFWKHLTRHF